MKINIQEYLEKRNINNQLKKCYIIPIDAMKRAFLGVKSLNNPYGKGRMWNQGMPNVFGGNIDDNDIMQTLKRETLEESHHKIIIDNDVTLEHPSLTPIHYSHQDRYDMIFFALFGHFQYIPNANTELDNPAYKETTGEIVSFNIKNDIPIEGGQQSVANAILNKFRNQFDGLRLRDDQSIRDFSESEMVIAIRNATEFILDTRF